MSSSNSDIEEEEVASENFMSSMSPNSDVEGGKDAAYDSDTVASDYVYVYDDEDGVSQTLYHDDDCVFQPQYQSLYNQDPISCPICCEENIDSGCGLILPNCGHSLCVDCFTKYIEVEVGRGNADNIKCPFKPFCNEAVTMDVLKEVVDEKSFQRLERLKDAAFVLKNPGYRHCPTPDCGNIVLCGVLCHEFPSVPAAAAAAPPRICDCFKCGKTSCLLCGASFHEGLTCDEHEMQQREEELQRQAANIIGNAYLRFRNRPNRGRPDPDMDMEELLGRNQSRGLLRRSAMGMRRMLMGMRRMQTQENNYEFELNAAESTTLGITNTSSGEIENPNPGGIESISTNIIKRCQRCGNGIERSEGCLHMKCRCGYKFCYKCGANLDAGCDCTE
mmetsp:Transcript_12415/g.18482  ORF Transcript_12415/g.18482 Transcript_12415/m.18482 type:complete len:390 (+) Transcript_12415:33-1202(+)